jgi:zinc protease
VYQQLDNPAERVLGLGLFELLHGQAELLPQMPQRLDAITPEAVAAAAKALSAGTRAVLTVIPGGMA